MCPMISYLVAIPLWPLICQYETNICSKVHPMLHCQQPHTPVTRQVKENLIKFSLSTDGTSVSLWWKCLSTPFIYTLFYIIYIIYTFGYFTHTVYTHSLPCVLFIICVLCVFYDSIHVLNVMFFSEPYLVLFIIKVSKQVYKVLWWSRIFQLKAYTRLCRMCAALQPSLWWVKNFLRQQSIRQFRYLRYGCPHPFSFINPCVNGVSLLLLFGLVLSTTLCASFLQ